MIGGSIYMGVVFGRRYGLLTHRILERFPESLYAAYLKSIERLDLDSRILIEIPAFRDPELILSMRSALVKAANPGRIFFAVCYQGDDLEEFDRVCAFPNCRTKYFAEREAPGLCAARYEASLLYSGEEYVLHIDSHMRFASCWDVVLIDQYARCPDGKRVISEYCMGYGRFYGEAPSSPVFDQHASFGGRTVGFSNYQPDGFKPRFISRTPFHGPDPKLGAFIGGHFLFGTGQMDLDVPPDPDMFFVADEASVAMRLWTHGYDIYHPGVRCAYHLYDRGSAAKKRDAGQTVRRFARGSKASDQRKESESLRTRQLYGVRDEGIDMGRFGTGAVRSVQDYYNFAGVNYKSRSAVMFGYNGTAGSGRISGDMAPACIAGDVVADKAHPMHKAMTDRAWSARICVLVTASQSHDELVHTVRSLVSNADNPNRVHVIVIAQLVDRPYLEQAEQLGARIVHCECLGAGHAHWVGEAHIPDDADYVLYSEEHMYYAPGWDMALAGYSEYCGGRSVISDWGPGLHYDDLPIHPSQGCLTGATGVSEYGHPRIGFGRYIDCRRPVRGAFLIGHNIFVPACIARDVRHSPDMWFNTDESYMTYRYWCAGVDLYHAPFRFCFHYYDGKRSSGRSTVLEADRDLSRPKMRYLLGLSEQDHDADTAFRLGSARSLKSFEAFAGIDLRSGKVSQRAVVCAFGDDTCNYPPAGKASCRKDGARWMATDALKGVAK